LHLFIKTLVYDLLTFIELKKQTTKKWFLIYWLFAYIQTLLEKLVQSITSIQMLAILVMVRGVK
jgi:hypothetical protein